jgi:hypothetical protein
MTCISHDMPTSLPIQAGCKTHDARGLTGHVVGEKRKTQAFIWVQLHDAAETQATTIVPNHQPISVSINLPPYPLSAIDAPIILSAVDIALTDHRRHRLLRQDTPALELPPIG